MIGGAQINNSVEAMLLLAAVKIRLIVLVLEKVGDISLMGIIGALRLC